MGKFFETDYATQMLRFHGIRRFRYRESDIEEHKQEVDSRGFLSGIANLASNLSRGRELNEAHKEDLEKLDVARTTYDEKVAIENSLKKEVNSLEIAFAETPLGKERKRQEEERLKKELEQQRERERYALKERELMRQRAMGLHPKEDGEQQSQGPRIRM